MSFPFATYTCIVSTPPSPFYLPGSHPLLAPRRRHHHLRSAAAANRWRLGRQAWIGGGFVSGLLPAQRRRRPVAGPLPALRRRCRAPTCPAGAPTGGGSVAGPGSGAYRPGVAIAPSLAHRPGVAIAPSLAPYQWWLRRRARAKSPLEFRTPPAETGLCLFTAKSRAHGSISAAAAGRPDSENRAN